MNRNADFDEYIDEFEDSVTIAGIEFRASEILFSCDPVAYGVMLSDWEAEQEQEDEEPEVCSAEDAWDSLTAEERDGYANDREWFIVDYNNLNNL